jgi:hypothetical protein
VQHTENPLKSTPTKTLSVDASTPAASELGVAMTKHMALRMSTTEQPAMPNTPKLNKRAVKQFPLVIEVSIQAGLQGVMTPFPS